MINTDQLHFVRELCRNIADDVCKKIVKGYIPNEWDGHELRTLLAEKFADAAHMSKHSLAGKRKREYNNAVIVNNL